MIYIGDLSKEDAKLLSALAKTSMSIIEFGAGASTQILAQSAPEGTQIVSVETDPAWISRTQQNLLDLGIRHPVQFLGYDSYLGQVRDKRFDLVFVDGKDELRYEFAEAMWPHLDVGGKMLFHDTRRWYNDALNLFTLASKMFEEVQSVLVNQPEGNISIITKKARVSLVDWNLVERRAPWEAGYTDKRPDNWLQILKAKEL